MIFKSSSVLFIALTISFFTKPGNAQILNADRFGQRDRGNRPFIGDLAFGFNITKEKQTVFKINNAGDFSYGKGNSLFILANKVEFLRSAGQNILNGGFVHFRNRNFMDKAWNPELFLQYQWIGVRGLENRALAGGNLRFRIQKDKNGNLYWAIGVMYEFERWSYTAVDVAQTPPNSQPINFERVKLNSYLSLSRALNSSISASLISYYQGEVNDTDLNPRISASAELNFKINESLGFSVLYSSFYDSKPSVPIDKFFFSMTNAITFHF